MSSASADDVPPIDVDRELDLLRRFEPILRFNEGELFLPASVEDYVACCELFERGPDGARTQLAEKGSLTVERLADLGAAHPRPGQYLRFVDEPLTRLQAARWRTRSDRPRFHGASRLARVGVFSRGIDALNRASLMFRGKNASGTEAAAETRYRTEMRPDHHPYYGRVVRDSSYTVLQYWYFYAFNDWRSRVYGVNDHEADWEQVTIYLADADGDGELAPAWFVSSAHDEVGDDLRRRHDDPDLTIIDGHLVIHPGLGSHSGAYLRGEYLTTHDSDAFGPVLRLTRKITRTLLPWTREEEHTGLSIPYIDYSRGDGVSIGPGQDRQWTPVLIDEATPWVVHFRGLWGNDTQDPLGGERGPAGPRYDRSTTVRQSWGDPLGWAGLRKVPANPRQAAETVVVRMAEIEDTLAALDARVDAHQNRLRAQIASGETVDSADDAALLLLTGEAVELRDEHLLLAHAVDRPPAPDPPHAHLRHRRVPLPTEARGRRRTLAIWSAVSTSFVLAIVIVMLVRPGWTVASSGLEAIVIVFAIEALARRQFARFALLALVALAIFFLLIAFASALVDDWRIALSTPLALAAVALLFVNVRELLRD